MSTLPVLDDLLADLEDVSTEVELTFQIQCPRCQEQLRSMSRPYDPGTAGAAAKYIGDGVGGAAGAVGVLVAVGAKMMGQAIHDQGRPDQRDSARRTAALELLPKVGRCSRCHRWHCLDSCFDVGLETCGTCLRTSGPDAQPAPETAPAAPRGEARPSLQVVVPDVEATMPVPALPASVPDAIARERWEPLDYVLYGTLLILVGYGIWKLL